MKMLMISMDVVFEIGRIDCTEFDVIEVSHAPNFVCNAIFIIHVVEHGMHICLCICGKFT